MNKDSRLLPYRPNVGIVLMNKKGEIFAGKRLRGPEDAWQMPQGGIDKNETPLAAAYRELKEETGVAQSDVEFVSETADWLIYDFPDEVVASVWGGKYRGQKQKWFLFKLLEGDDVISIDTSDPEFDAWKWLTPSQLVEKIVPFKKDVYRALLAELL